MGIPTAEAMLKIAVTKKENRKKVELDATKRGYPFAIDMIREYAESEMTSIEFDKLVKAMKGQVNEVIFTQMLIDDKFLIYMDRSVSVIGRKRVTWDPEVAAAALELDKPDFPRSTEP